MTNRSVYVVLGAFAGTLLVLAARSATAGGQSGALVRLQPLFGTAQTGHTHITGTSRAGAFSGSGSGLINLPAGELTGTIQNARLPNPLSLTGSVIGGAIGTFENTASSVLAYGLRARATGTDGIALLAEAPTGNNTGTIAIKAHATGSLGTAVFALASGVSGYAVLANSSAGTLAASLRANNDNPVGTAVRADADLGGGTGVYSSGDRGGYFYGTSTGLEVRGATAGAVAVDATASSSSTSVSVGVRGLSQSPTGIGVYGINSATTGANIGVLGEANSSGGRGIFGSVDFATGVSYAGRFENSSEDGRAIYALASDTGAASTPYGVRGQASTNGNGFAVYALGDLGASGVKPFRIDHPSDPTNKYLLHYSSESPFPQNFYNGNVTTDAHGYAWVELPEYFSQINTNFKYILTVIDDADSDAFVMAKVSKEIRDNRFQIRTSAPNVRVSWEVKADRNDDRVKVNRPTDIRQKTGAEKGTYQHPEYYGLPAESGIDYAPKPNPATKRK